MKLELKLTKEFDAKYIQVNASVRYWEDAEINGETALESGKNVPFADGSMWRPLIDIDYGVVIDWPQGVEASFHFKVCDAGRYQLLDGKKDVIADIDGYVPSGLCHGDNGYGDYIIFSVGKDGAIKGYSNKIDASDWSDED